MTTSERALWKVVEEELDTPTSSQVRSFCRLQGWVRSYLESEVQDDKPSTVEVIVKTIRDLRASGLDPNPAEVISSPASANQRWQLLQELNAAYHDANPEAFGSRDWQPLSISRMVLNLDVHPTTSGMTISLDSRISLKALMTELRRVWPHLLEAGWIRRSRPLGPQVLALARFVCLEATSGTTWRARMEAWNESHSRWRYHDVRKFERRFRRAEKELSGKPYGLEWFYEPTARLDRSDLVHAARTGDRSAARLLDRHAAMLRGLLEDK